MEQRICNFDNIYSITGCINFARVGGWSVRSFTRWSVDSFILSPALHTLVKEDIALQRPAQEIPMCALRH